MLKITFKTEFRDCSECELLTSGFSAKITENLSLATNSE
jgi:hypothetical protein